MPAAKYKHLYPEWVEMYESNSTTREIANKYFTTHTSVRDGLKSCGIILRTRQETSENQSRLLKLKWQDPEFKSKVVNARIASKPRRHAEIKARVLADGVKSCIRCKRELPLGEFRTRDKSTDGLTYYCKKCLDAQNTEYQLRYPKRSWATKSIYGHRSRGIKVDFNVKELEKFVENANECEICGAKLDWSENRKIQKQRTPTLDRTDNEKIMRFDNIKVVCYQCNTTKGARTMKEFVDYCKLVANKFGSDSHGIDNLRLSHEGGGVAARV